MWDRDGTIRAPSIPIPIPLTVVRFHFQFKIISSIPILIDSGQGWVDSNSDSNWKITSRFNSDSDSFKLEKGSIPIPIPKSESELSHLWCEKMQTLCWWDWIWVYSIMPIIPGIGIRVFQQAGIGIRIGIKGLGLESEWNQGLSCWNRNQSFEFSWNRNRNQAIPGIVHHWSILNSQGTSISATMWSTLLYISEPWLNRLEICDGKHFASRVIKNLWYWQVGPLQRKVAFFF